MLWQRVKVKVAHIQPQLNGELPLSVLSIGRSWLSMLPSLTMIGSDLSENLCHCFLACQIMCEARGRHPAHGPLYVFTKDRGWARSRRVEYCIYACCSSHERRLSKLLLFQVLLNLLMCVTLMCAS